MRTYAWSCLFTDACFFPWKLQVLMARVLESMRLFRAHPPALVMRMKLSLVCGRYTGLSCLFVHLRPNRWCFVTDGASPTGLLGIDDYWSSFPSFTGRIAFEPWGRNLADLARDCVPRQQVVPRAVKRPCALLRPHSKPGSESVGRVCGCTCITVYLCWFVLFMHVVNTALHSQAVVSRWSSSGCIVTAVNGGCISWGLSPSPVACFVKTAWCLGFRTVDTECRR